MSNPSRSKRPVRDSAPPSRLARWTSRAGTNRRGMKGRLAGQLRKKLISGKREEFDECRAGGDLVENLSCERIVALVIRFRADVRSNLAQFLVHEAAEQLGGDLAAVVEHASGMPDPLPDLGAGDLAGGSVFHQVEDGHAA